MTDMSTGERLLVANENVQVGNGCLKKQQVKQMRIDVN